MSHTRDAIVDRLLQDDRRYWTEQLAGDPSATSLAADWPAGARPSSTATAPMSIDAETAARTWTICDGRPALVLAVLATALKVCLHKYTGERDVTIGTPPTIDRGALAGRARALPVRDDVDPARSLRDLLRQVKQTLADAFAHQKYPLDRLVVDGEPARDPATLTHVVLRLEELQGGEGLDDLAPDLLVTCHCPDGRIGGTIRYDGGRHHPDTIAAFAARFARALRTLVFEPDRPLGSVALLDEAERGAVVATFNATAAPYPAETAVHRLIEAQVMRTPDAVAVRCGADVVTYRELNARANQCARALRERGIGPGTTVGIRMQHSIGEIVALLGVLKAGAAYVPFDPGHPGERLRPAVEDAALAAVIGDVGDDVTGELGRPVIEIAADGATFGDREAVDLPDAAGPRELAYIIFTSGSTGRPKGVAIEHRSLVNYAWWARDVYLREAPGDVALFTSIAFDLTVTTVFAPLLDGRAIAVYPTREGESPVLDVFREGRAAIVKLTPSHLVLVADQPLRETVVRVLIVGGEALETALARRIHEQTGGRIALFNEYGPTEATVGCMIHRFDPATDRARTVPIGRPAANTQIHVLDPDGHPVGTGMIGEIVIAGDGLARGYVHRDDLTALAFVAHPFEPGARVYRTGDRARRLPGGGLEFLGRADDQIKLHGYRIDLDEYRHALNAHPQISDSVTRVLRDADGADVLVAYYVARQEIEVGELRAFLGRRLIAGTLPQMFAHLRRLPLTLNGKVNVRALPGLDDLRRRLAPKSAEPRTDGERALAGIWQDVLRIGQVGIHDSFFELGGHSLLATQVVSRIRDLTGIELPLRTIFEAPTIAELAVRLDGARASATPAPAPIPRRDSAQPAPLSFAQQRLWFLNELDSTSAVYNITTRLDVTGALDADVLQRCLDTIVARHEALRTTFEADMGRPAQVIRPALTIPIGRVDLTGGAADARAAAVEAEATRVSTAPFDLQRGPLLRVTLVNVAPDRHALLFAMHHIIGDGWSMGVLLRELATVYDALSAGRAPALPDLPLQYADYAVWQREHLSGALLATQLAYWKTTLAGLTPLDLPTDRPRAALQTFRGGAIPFVVPPALAAAIETLSRDAGVTPFMTLLAAFEVFLHRYTGQTDIAVGSPIANRHRTETEPIIGFFANTLVLRTDVSGNPTFRALLARVRETALGAYAHQDLPFERLVEEMQPDRDLSHNPLFQVMCAVNTAPLERPRLGSLAIDRLPAETGTAKFDLNLSLDATADGFAGTLDYNGDIFDEATARRMAAHLSCVIASACARPDAPIGDLDLQSAEERARVVVDWNRTRVAFDESVCVHSLVEEMAVRRPEAPAVAFRDAVLTFRELNARANQLAHRLQRLGVGPEVLVGVCLERSIDMAVGVLAVLKAGGAYVPLDPDYPAERLAFMVEDTNAPVILAQPSTRPRLPATKAVVLDLDAERALLSREPDGNLGVDVHPESLLYVIYTSGSTGRPKGTALSHRALGNLIRWHLRDLARGTAMLQFASLSFDASFHEMFAAWGSGRLLVMIPEGWRRDPEELFPMLARHGVEMAILPVVVLHQWAEHHAQDPGRFSMLRDVITTGEQLVITKPIVDLFSRLDDCTLHNHYGPSETHVVTAFTLTTPPAEWPSRPSIGRPIVNSTVYILDKRMAPVPVGVYGELYLGGTNVARGYLGRPDLTAARFIPDPFTDEPGARLYAVGDVGRWLPDGTIEFKGRLDDQAKIRGFRVEPGEVEGAINRHQDVSQSVVVVDGTNPTDKRLVAYVVPAAGRSVAPADLRAYLQGCLPDYLVPAVLMVLPGLALTPNGKIDRRALPKPVEDASATRAASRPPETPAERYVARLWAEVLERDGAGVHDSFFHVGGHSLLATQVVSRIRRGFGVDLPLRVMFEAPTIAGLVEHLSRLTGGRDVLDEIADALLTVAQLSASEVSERLHALERDDESRRYGS